jgi:hypothetical protein
LNGGLAPIQKRICMIEVECGHFFVMLNNVHGCPEELTLRLPLPLGSQRLRGRTTRDRRLQWPSRNRRLEQDRDENGQTGRVQSGPMPAIRSNRKRQSGARVSKEPLQLRGCLVQPRGIRLPSLRRNRVPFITKSSASELNLKTVCRAVQDKNRLVLARLDRGCIVLSGSSRRAIADRSISASCDTAPGRWNW